MTRLRVVVVAPMVPIDSPPHAGGHYLQSVVHFAESVGEVSVIVPNGPFNRANEASPGAPQQLLVVRHDASTLRRRLVNRLVAVADRQLRRVDPAVVNLPFALGLLRPGPAREALEQADIIDLQWSESIRLARLARRLNPQARVVGTFHDVQSQFYGREPARNTVSRLRRRVAISTSQRHERRGVASLDEVAVFSHKDARLLGDPPHVRVISPPLASGQESMPAPPPRPPTVVFVAYFRRAVNEDAATWFLREVWPLVRRAVPDAELRLVGAGASAALTEEVARRPAVTLTGFVDDLRAEYAAAWLAVIPLRQGAGVKFKTIEAMLHGVPVVGTSVGVEGIDAPELFAGVADASPELAAAMIGVLTDPGPALRRAAAAQEWAARTYSADTFSDAVSRHYLIG